MSLLHVESLADYDGFERVPSGRAHSTNIAILDDALTATRDENQSLMRSGASERAICHRVSVHLERLLLESDQTWNVDCEYNKIGSEASQTEVREYVVKKLRLDERERDVNPDLVVHRRGAQDNELVVEMKVNGRSNTTKETVTKDLTKLRLFRNDPNFQYREAAFVLIHIGESPNWDIHRFA